MSDNLICECGHREEHHGRDRWGYCLFGCNCQSFRPDDLAESLDKIRAEIVVNGETVGHGIEGMLAALDKMTKDAGAPSTVQAGEVESGEALPPPP